MGLPGAVPEFGWNHLPAQHFELCAVGVSRSVGTDSGPYGQKNQAERFAGCQSEPDVCSGLLIQRLVLNAHWLGHSTIGTTANIYTYLDENNKLSSANAIIAILPEM